LSKTFTAKSVLAISATGLLVALTPGVSAFASPVCSAGGTLLSSGVCELKFTQPGSHTFTPTSTITKIDALIVGAGGAAGQETSADAYGGGGGDVKIVSLATSGVIEVSVGAGAISGYSTINDTAVTQATTTTKAEGGRSAINGYGGTSGSGLRGWDNCGSFFPIGGAQAAGICYSGGGGAGGASTSELGGPGLVVNALTGASTSLFADDTTCYGGGGSVGGFRAWSNSRYSAYSGASVCGGGGVTVVTNGTAFTSYDMITPRANSGSGGAKYVNAVDAAPAFTVAQPGANGIAVIRYQDSPAAALANTGSNGEFDGFAAGLGLLALGLGAFSLRKFLNSQV
jgi:hypothetical protein